MEDMERPNPQAASSTMAGALSLTFGIIGTITFGGWAINIQEADPSSLIAIIAKGSMFTVAATCFFGGLIGYIVDHSR